MTYQESYNEIKTKFEDLGLCSAPETILFGGVIKIVGDIHRYYQSAIDVLERDAIMHGRQAEAMKDFGKRINEENNAKLMAIYYSLDMLATCGTHHEKNVVLVHLKATIDRMINREFNGISYKNDDLPF